MLIANTSQDIWINSEFIEMIELKPYYRISFDPSHYEVVARVNGKSVTLAQFRTKAEAQAYVLSLPLK